MCDDSDNDVLTCADLSCPRAVILLHSVCNSGGQPSGACFGPDNNVYVADQAHGAVVVFLEGKLQVVVQGYEEHMFKVCCPVKAGEAHAYKRESQERLT